MANVTKIWTWRNECITWPSTLVGTGWNPGVGRVPVPGTQAEFGALIRAWVDTGAVCPREETVSAR